MPGYVARHWRGELSLALSFWVNLVALRTLVFWLQETWTGGGGETRGLALLPVAIVLVALHGVLFVWQAVGVVRAGERHARDSGTSVGLVGAVLGVVALFWLTLTYALEGYQTTLPPVADELERAADYALDLGDGGRELRLSGLLVPGVTRRAGAVLDAEPAVERVVLESPGGNVYEGRGLARLFRERGLATRIETRCASACAIAFIGGARRTLGPEAKLGLHRYRMDAAYAVIVTDAEREQRRDRALYAEAGVAAWFLERMFDAGADRMWWPDADELGRAGVVHGIER